MPRISVPRKIIDEARELADKKSALRKGNRDKFLTGTEKEMDRVGMVFECVTAWVFNQPWPELYVHHVDEFDFELTVPEIQNRQPADVIKFDVKASRDRLINKDQFERKTEVEAYLFGHMDYFSAMPWICDAVYEGWIFSKNVPVWGKLEKADNGSEFYRITREKLEKNRWPNHREWEK